MGILVHLAVIAQVGGIIWQKHAGRRAAICMYTGERCHDSSGLIELQALFSASDGHCGVWSNQRRKDDNQILSLANLGVWRACLDEPDLAVAVILAPPELAEVLLSYARYVQSTSYLFLRRRQLVCGVLRLSWVPKVPLHLIYSHRLDKRYREKKYGARTAFVRV